LRHVVDTRTRIAPWDEQAEGHKGGGEGDGGEVEGVVDARTRHKGGSEGGGGEEVGVREGLKRI
jgi:hypothetical protein